MQHLQQLTSNRTLEELKLVLKCRKRTIRITSNRTLEELKRRPKPAQNCEVLTSNRTLEELKLRDPGRMLLAMPLPIAP